uniref:Uncharacterized protein n=1 Tax=Vitis vinifera TaxID=29760 RepID=F6HN16_VITVI
MACHTSAGFQIAVGTREQTSEDVSKG